MKYRRLPVALLILATVLPAIGFAQAPDLAGLRQQAEQGDARAQTELGYRYHTGEDVERDFEAAVQWYLRAAEQGQADAQYNLGVAYAFGEGVERDLQQATAWYRRAAEQGHKVAAFSLGLAYLYGDGVDRDTAQAANWFHQAAEQGYIRAQVHLASLYHAGDGIAQDYEQAAYWYRQAAEHGDVTAQYNLGNLYLTGRGIGKDREKARYWFRQAADQGYALAQTALERLEQRQLSRPAETTAETPAPDNASDDQRVVSPPLDSAEATAETPLKVAPDIAAAAEPAATETETGDEAETVTVATDPEAAGFANLRPAREENIPAENPTSGNRGFFSQLFGGQPKAPAESSQGAQSEEHTNETEKAEAVAEEPVAESGQAETSDTTETAPDTDMKLALQQSQPVTEKATISISNAAQEALAAENYARAVSLLQAEALAGNAAAETRLGDLYFQGQGVEQNHDRALLWYRRAAKRNYADAQFNLGNMYLLGEGVLRNDKKALAWYEKAAEQGHEAAQKNLESLKRRMAEGQRYQPEQHASPSQDELEAAVEQNAPVEQEAVPTGQSEPPQPKRIISPPLEAAAETAAVEGETSGSADETTTAKAGDSGESDDSSEPVATPSRRVVTPPIETAPEDSAD